MGRDEPVFVGTCFEEEEDGSVTAKASQVWNQIATDDQGRYVAISNHNVPIIISELIR